MTDAFSDLRNERMQDFRVEGFDFDFAATHQAATKTVAMDDDDAAAPLPEAGTGGITWLHVKQVMGTIWEILKRKITLMLRMKPNKRSFKNNSL